MTLTCKWFGTRRIRIYVLTPSSLAVKEKIEFNRAFSVWNAIEYNQMIIYYVAFPI